MKLMIGNVSMRRNTYQLETQVNLAIRGRRFLGKSRK